jgi:hypothetical protein
VPRFRKSLLTVLAALVLTACAGESQAPGILTIISHQDGDIVDTASIQVRGTAPAGAEIVQDISFASDKRTSADAEGNWVLTVDLDEGDNDLTFRIGSYESTGKTIRVTYRPSGAEESSAANASAPQPSTAAEGTPQPTPVPTPAGVTFDDGDYIVGTDVLAGTYRTREPAFLCYWERLSGFGGTLDEIIANGSGGGYHVITIAAGDAGFSSSGCGTWTADLSAVTSSQGPVVEDGIYIVGVDMAAGTWRSTGGVLGCYAARLSGFGGTLDEVIANDISTEGGLIISIAASDKGFETTGCGTWTKVS